MCKHRARATTANSLRLQNTLRAGANKLCKVKSRDVAGSAIFTYVLESGGRIYLKFPPTHSYIYIINSDSFYSPDGLSRWDFFYVYIPRWGVPVGQKFITHVPGGDFPGGEKHVKGVDLK